MKDKCTICSLHDGDDVILETTHWRTFLSWQQDRLGRCLTASKEHRRSLIELTPEEWEDWAHVLHLLHPALYKAFGPTNINVACLMNGAFLSERPQPHVHWWSIPRYDRAVAFAGETFNDDRYPHLTFELEDHPSAEQEHRVAHDVSMKIVEAIRAQL